MFQSFNLNNQLKCAINKSGLKRWTVPNEAAVARAVAALLQISQGIIALEEEEHLTLRKEKETGKTNN